MDKRKGLLGLVDSKRFVSLLILLVSFLLVIRFPEYTPHITTIASLFGVAAFVLVGGYTLEQAVEAWRGLPANLADVIRAIVEEVLAAGGSVSVKAETGGGSGTSVPGGKVQPLGSVRVDSLGSPPKN